MSTSLESLMRGLPDQTRSRPVLNEMAWFVGIGGGGALVLWAITTAAISLRTGLPDWIVAALCYAALIVPVYLLHRRLSFRSDAAHRRSFPRYLAVQFSAIVLVSLFSFVCYSVLGIATAIGSLIVLVLTAAVNFVILKLWAFAGNA